MSGPATPMFGGYEFIKFWIERFVYAAQKRHVKVCLHSNLVQEHALQIPISPVSDFLLGQERKGSLSPVLAVSI
eukprot:1160433-Pelagomonas_calceolata.AAC.2